MKWNKYVLDSKKLGMYKMYMWNNISRLVLRKNETYLFVLTIFMIVRIEYGNVTNRQL
jgi:hypothetical protein